MFVEQTQSDTVWLTPAAAQAVKDLMVKRNLEGYALRVFVSGMGCSGPQYGLGLEGHIRDEDLTYEYEGVKLVVDEISINYLHGATIDYVEGVAGTGFKINNPNAFTACGCGTSESAQNGGCSGCG